MCGPKWSTEPKITTLNNLLERLPAKDLPEPVHRSRVLCFAHSIEIHELPPDGRQIGDAGQVDERPVRLPAFYRQQEGAIVFGKHRVEDRDKPLPRIEQCLERHRLANHLPEFSVIEAGDVPAPRSQKLRNRPVVADQVHEKGLEQVPADAFLVQQQRDVE